MIGAGGTSRFPQTPSTGPLSRTGRSAAAFLALEDGTVFRGESVAAEGLAVGEAVFTTAMTGYQEIVTDPSFAEQIVCFTAPMIGNYGVADGRSESSTVHAIFRLFSQSRVGSGV